MNIFSPLKNILKSIRDLIRLLVSFVKIKVSTIDSNQLEIGSGPTKRDGWLTLDMCSEADVYWDLRFELPFKEYSFDKVYCSHVLEHFSYRDLMTLLRNVHRVLRPGGQFLITVPDASLFVEAYLGKREAEPLMQYKPAISSMENMDILNYIFYMDGHHKFMFDAGNLAFHCRAAGFLECVPRLFDPKLDMTVRDYESLYMLCRKR